MFFLSTLDTTTPSPFPFPFTFGLAWFVWFGECSSGYKGDGGPPPVIDDSDQWEQWQTVTSAKTAALDKQEGDRYAVGS